MGKRIEVKPGEKFGKWIIIKEIDPKIISNIPRRMFRCRCECGNEKDVQLSCLRNGHSTSCGCEQKKRASEANYKHGLSDKHPLYGTWKNMKKRCNNPNATEYKIYGGKGITVCDEWENFEPFYNWAINNGWKEHLTIDRIDVNGNYCPENCRWVSMKIQENNTTTNHYIEYNDKVYTLSTLSDFLNIPYNVVRYRISTCSWTVEQLIQFWHDRNQSK